MVHAKLGKKIKELIEQNFSGYFKAVIYTISNLVYFFNKKVDMDHQENCFFSSMSSQKALITA